MDKSGKSSSHTKQLGWVLLLIYMFYADKGRKRLPLRTLSPYSAKIGLLDTWTLLYDHVLLNNFYCLRYDVVGWKKEYLIFMV